MEEMEVVLDPVRPSSPGGLDTWREGGSWGAMDRKGCQEQSVGLGSRAETLREGWGWGRGGGSGKAGEIQTVKAAHRFAGMGPREAPEAGEQGT